MIFGINTTSHISKLLYVISRAVRRVKFETILKLSWNTTALSQSNCRNFICSSINIYISFCFLKLFLTKIRFLRTRYNCFINIKMLLSLLTFSSVVLMLPLLIGFNWNISVKYLKPLKVPDVLCYFFILFLKYLSDFICARKSWYKIH